MLSLLPAGDATLVAGNLSRKGLLEPLALQQELQQLLSCHNAEEAGIHSVGGVGVGCSAALLSLDQLLHSCRWLLLLLDLVVDVDVVGCYLW